MKIIEGINLKKTYVLKKGLFGKKVYINALDGVSLSIFKGETFGLVGESGCGKSSLGKVLLRLEDPTEGKILFENQDITNLSSKDMKLLRRKMQIVFQDPYASLNPRKSVFDILGEPFVVHYQLPKKERLEKVKFLLEIVGLPLDSVYKYPHQFSGGQRQRIAIARAIALEPSFIVADEPLSALDVSVQTQIIELFLRLQENLGLTYLFISHDINVVAYIAQRIGVMYRGKLVEEGLTGEILKRPLHPYTKLLLKSFPKKMVRSGDVCLFPDVKRPNLYVKKAIRN
jgi:ABC-type oligopeptide transport system ATPase subunit